MIGHEPATTTVLKQLLEERHLQTYSAFCREYKLVASRTGEAPSDIPSKAQFYRWLSGQIQRLPYANHCRVLESMLPGWKARELFKPTRSSDVHGSPTPPSQATDSVRLNQVGYDVSEVYSCRVDFLNAYPPIDIVEKSDHLRAAGISLNVICQQLPDRVIHESVERGALIEMLFLDPAGRWTMERDLEEGHEPGTLASLTTLNINAMRKLRDSLPPERSDLLRLRKYDEIPRYNMTLADDDICIMQPYLPFSRGLESPTFYVSKSPGRPSRLFPLMRELFEQLWERSVECH